MSGTWRNTESPASMPKTYFPGIIFSWNMKPKAANLAGSRWGDARRPHPDHRLCRAERRHKANYGLGCRQADSGVVHKGMGTNLTRTKTNAKEVVVPKFSSEAEEARWWDAHRSQVEAEIRRRMKRKRPLAPGGLLRQEEPTQPVTLRIAREDLETARHLAAQRGLRYQTYIKMLLRGALAKERKAANVRRKPSVGRRRLIARSAK
jgi:uncharacterized protein (DUF4415 family)